MLAEDTAALAVMRSSEQAIRPDNSIAIHKEVLELRDLLENSY
jgi:hypothetical protein